MLRERIIEWTQAHREEFAADLGKLIAVRSVRGEAQDGMPFGPGPAEALRGGLALCESYGLAVKNYENYAGSADLAADKPPMLDILAHLDVVGEGDGWDTDPYTMVLKDDGCLYGRGVSDDKGGLLAAAYAMRCVRELAQRGYTVILSTHDPQHALRFADRVLALSGGEVAAFGATNDVLTPELLRTLYGVDTVLLQTEHGPAILPRGGGDHVPLDR